MHVAVVLHTFTLRSIFPRCYWLCDSNNRFTFVDIGVDSVLFQKMLENTFNTSDDRQVSVDGDLLSFIFVGDEAFGLSSRMVRPYRGKNLSQKKEIFYYRSSVKSPETIIKACCTLHNFEKERHGVELETLNVIRVDEGEAVLIF